MTRKSFVAIALNLLFVLAFDRTGFSMENQAVGDDEASLGKGNVMDNQDTMDASS